MRNRQIGAFRRRFGAALVPGLIVIAMAALAGCSGGGSSSGAASAEGAAVSASGPAAAAPSAAGAAGSAKSVRGTGQDASAARLTPAGQQLIYTAQLTVRAHDVGAAVSRATSIVSQAGGYVSSENASNDPNHPAQSSATIELKIPAALYAATLGELAGGGLGTRLALQQQAQDVTQQVADVASRVTSDEAAIVQLRALLSHAGSVGDLLSVQNQINDEESALEALQAQQRALGDETSYATVTMTIVGPKATPVTHPRPAPPSLAGGLGAGWHALRVTVSWILALLGAVAPFAAVAALAGFVVYRGRRWLIRRRPAAGPASPEN